MNWADLKTVKPNGGFSRCWIHWQAPVSQRRGVALYFASTEEFTYNTPPYQYEPHFPILDVLMWNPSDVVANALTTKTTLVQAS